VTVYPFVEGNQAHTSGPNGAITRVVLHATVSPCINGGARNVASYFQRADAGGLAHYVVDPNEVVRCADERVSTWHAPPNAGSIGVEMTDPQTGSASRWQDVAHVQMLRRTAALLADICDRHSLPLVYVDAAGLKAGRRGITTHHQVSLAFGQSSHTDPDAAGPFPLALLLGMITPARTPAPGLSAHQMHVRRVAALAALARARAVAAHLAHLAHLARGRNR